MNRIKTILQSIAIEIILIFCIGCANLHPTPIWYFFFYNLLYGIVLSLLIPLYLLRKEKNISDFIGVKKWGRKQSIVLAVFIAFSVGGQLIPIAASGSAIPWNVLPMGIIPLIMTTFFEEFLFRGFMQNKFWNASCSFFLRTDVFPLSSGLSRVSYLGRSSPAVCRGRRICRCL